MSRKLFAHNGMGKPLPYNVAITTVCSITERKAKVKGCRTLFYKRAVVIYS